MQPAILPWKGVIPKIHKNVFLAQNASIIGDVEIDDGSSVWFGCTIRGDVSDIKIGKNTNIQDGTVIHVTRNGHPTKIGDNVTIGHNSTLHACTLESGCFIGMSATILDGVIVQKGAMIGAGSLVLSGTLVKSCELWAGNPARKLRNLTADEITNIEDSAKRYAGWAKEYITNSKTTVALKRLENGKDLPLPFKGTEEAAGFDIHSAEDCILQHGKRKLVATGFAMALPDGWECQVRPRSGLAYKNGIGVVNAPGTIDSDYRGEVKVLLINHGKESFEIKKGMRIAQLVISTVPKISFKEVDDLSDTDRNSGGFGSTGV